MSSPLRCDAFVSALTEAASDLKAVRALIAAEKKYVRSFRTTPGSVRNALTDYRGAVERSALPPSVKAEVRGRLHVTKTEQAGLTARQKARTYDRQSSNRPIYSVDRFIETGEALLGARSYLDRVVGLAMLTGRRTAEILATASFEVDPRRPDTHVLFTGQTKTKGRGDVGTYSIPVLTSPARVIETLNGLRRDKGRWANEYCQAKAKESVVPGGAVEVLRRAHAAVSTDLNARVKKHLVGVLGDAETTTPHDLRKAYVEVAYCLSGNKKVARPVFHSQVLGHEESLSSSMAYHGYYIED